jgi:two-component system, LytTR family, sensor kinase
MASSRRLAAPLTRLLLLCLVWTVVGTVSFARHYLNSAPRAIDGSLLAAYAEWLSCYLPWGLLSYVVMVLEHRVPLGRRDWPRHALVLAAACMPISYAAAQATTACALAVASVTGRPLLGHVPSWIVPAPDLLGHALLYWSAVAGSAMLRTFLEARENERRAARLLLEKSQLESSLRQAELDALRMRLQPHFLFNSLQNISVLIRHDPETGSRMLTKLGDLLRAALGREGEAETTLRTEIALTEAYLAVEEMRFGDRLSSIVEIAPGTEDARVPTFLLQPLVENALRHGLRDVRQGGVVIVRSAVDRGALVLTVCDNGAGLPGGISTAAFGIGLGATSERLARMYPGRHTFALRPLPEGGTEARITLPLRLDASTEPIDRVPAAAAHRR